jgi:hypothetical protein
MDSNGASSPKTTRPSMLNPNANYCTWEGANKLLEIILTNYPYKGASFWVVQDNIGLYSIRSNTVCGLPKEKESEKA